MVGSGCVQDKCHTRTPRSVGRELLHQRFPRGLVVLGVMRQRQKGTWSKPTSGLRFPFVKFGSAFQLGARGPRLEVPCCRSLVSPAGVQGLPGSSPDGRPVPPRPRITGSVPWAASRSTNRQSDGSQSLPENRVRTVNCSGGGPGFGPACVGFDWISGWRLSPCERLGSQKKNEVTEGLLTCDPSPLMAVVITVGGCSEQECIVPPAIVGRASQVFCAGCAPFIRACVLPPRAKADEEGRASERRGLRKAQQRRV